MNADPETLSSTPVVLIGPSEEIYKGGIAHFTSFLAEELKKQKDLMFISWKRLYPPFLTSRTFKDQQSRISLTHTQATFRLDYMNPFTWISTGRSLRKIHPEKVVLTWVHPVHAPVYLVLMYMLRRRTTLQVLCHNVLPHESFPGCRWLSRLVFRLADECIVHGRAQAEALRQFNITAEVKELFLPVFNFKTSETKPKDRSPGSRTFLFFGVIREYKGLDLLLEAIATLQEADVHVTLKVAGEAMSPSTLEEIEKQVQELHLQENVELDIRYIPNEEVQEIFEGCDAVLLPYRSVTGSGPLMIALQFGKPVIATKVGALAEIVNDGQNGYVCEPTVPGLAEAIMRFLKDPIPEEGVRESAKAFSWERYVERLLEE